MGWSAPASDRTLRPPGSHPPKWTIGVGLKRHGRLVADNGLDWALPVASNERIPVLHEGLRRAEVAE